MVRSEASTPLAGHSGRVRGRGAVRAKPTRPPTLEELTALLQNAGDEQFATFLFVAAATGARRGELAALR
jgi:integrase